MVAYANVSALPKDWGWPAPGEATHWIPLFATDGQDGIAAQEAVQSRSHHLAGKAYGKII